jgi:hypothetical protein
MIPNTAPVSVQPASTAVATAATKKHTGFELSFDNLLDIVNPLQHLPVIGTLYRAITGDKIAAPEKIAGGALFGGLWGLVSSVADAAFEAVTGKDFGSTVLALFTGHHEPKTVAANATGAAASVVAPEPAADVGALMAALATKGVDSDTARRATYAYSKTINMAAADALR